MFQDGGGGQATEFGDDGKFVVVEFDSRGEGKGGAQHLGVVEPLAEVDVEDAQRGRAGGSDEAADGVAGGWSSLREGTEADGVAAGSEAGEGLGPGQVIPGGVGDEIVTGLSGSVEGDGDLSGGMRGIASDVGAIHVSLAQEGQGSVAEVIGADGTDHEGGGSEAGGVNGDVGGCSAEVGRVRVDIPERFTDGGEDQRRVHGAVMMPAEAEIGTPISGLGQDEPDEQELRCARDRVGGALGFGSDGGGGVRPVAAGGHFGHRAARRVWGRLRAMIQRIGGIGRGVHARRRWAGDALISSLNVLALGLLVVTATANRVAAAEIFVEAESLAEHGGWVLDTQYTHAMGSPFLLAHGLGKPVAEARGVMRVAEAGRYRVWVRTRDWVAPWNAPGAPGRFRVVLDGHELETDFGTEGAEWHWQAGGEIELRSGEVTVALRDRTGFDGRCDAILLSSDREFRPPEGEELVRARRRWLGNGEEFEEAGSFDLVVVGGGYAGLAAAISGARQGLSVALVQDRFVLGGNGSSEIRVWAQGGTMRGKYPHLGEIVEEFADRAEDSPGVAEQFGDARKEAVARREKNLALFLGHFVQGVQIEPGEGRIRSVVALEVRSGRQRRFVGKVFSDCTGHGALGVLAGAKYHMEPKGRMGMSNMWFWQEEETPQSWPETPWALALEPGDFPKQVKSKAQLEGKPFMKGEWFWESGFDKDAIQELEIIRDWNLRAVFGAFSALKHGVEKDKHTRAALKWVSHVGGTRESRMLEGDVILQREDIVGFREFPDGCVPTTWDIDLHYPKEQYAKKYPENPFISRAEFGSGVDRKNGYPVPYRCFYSTNVPNLFMAGRCISVSHEALGTVRVMRTCGMMGEVVGKAAYLSVYHATTPRGVYERHLPQLIELMGQPGAMRRDSISDPLRMDTSIAPVVAYGPKPDATPAVSSGVDAKTLPGVVIDDGLAVFRGEWGRGSGLRPFVGGGYRYHGAGEGAEARFGFQVPATGRYEVRVAWQPHENRSTRTLVILERPGQVPLRFRVNQREANIDPHGFHSLGGFDFRAGEGGTVVLSTEGADGYVHADCVQLLPAKE